MSVPVGLDELAAQIAHFGPTPYLLTVPAAGGRPHAVSVEVTVDRGDPPSGRTRALRVAPVGRRTAANAAEQPAVSLLWPPVEPGGYSLIVDALASAPERDGDPLVLVPERAVLHRSAGVPSSVEGGACGSDCVPIELA